MIRITQSTSDQAKAYFTQSLQTADYYINQTEMQGQFHGKLSERLGISGNTTREQFFALCDNLNPITGERLTQRTIENRTVGYDFTFSVPKSVSIVNALSSDNHIQEAFQKSVNDTMKLIEADMMTRVRVGDKDEDRKTDELIWAEFTHLTSRGLEGVTPDPHLHCHAYIFNATVDKSENNKIKAGQFRYIKRDAPYYQSLFYKILSDRLIDLGYNIKKNGKSFEIEGVGRNICELFSKRTRQINEIAKELGITDEQTLSELGAKTRTKKQKGLNLEELKADWRKQIRENIDRKEGELDAPIRYAPKKEQENITAKDCIDHSTTHSFERASVMPERRVLANAYMHSIGVKSVSPADINKTFNTDTRIIKVADKTQTLVTTADILKEEQKMVSLALKGLNSQVPLYETAPKINLEGQQAQAIEHILTTTDRVSIIMGGAGTGKSTVLKVAVQLIQKAGKEVILVAPSASASRGTLKEEGFENAETVSELLQNKKMQSKLQDNFLFMDEAGLADTAQMVQVLELAEKHNARLLLIGDISQHSSVNRGDSLRVLHSVAGIKTAAVSKIYRQRDEFYRDVVSDLSKGEVKTAFAKLDSMGSIKEIDRLNPHKQLVTDYIDIIKQNKTGLIVSPTRAQGIAVTESLREQLRQNNVIGKKETHVAKLSNLNMTEAQKSDWRNFEEGQVIQFSQNLPNIKRGSVWAVSKTGDKQVIIADKQGKTFSLPLDRAKDYNVYHKSEICLSKGDQVRITNNCFDEAGKRLNNGQALEIAAVRGGKTVLVNPKSNVEYILDQEFGHLDHNYCITSHSSQGKTVDTVLVHMPESSLVAADSKQFYVSISRGRDSAIVYTDAKDELLESVKLMKTRQSAIELTKNGAHMDYINNPERRKDNTLEMHKPQVSHPKSKQVSYEPEL